MIRIRVSRGASQTGAFAARHNLIKLRIVEQTDRMLRFLPTRGDFRDRVLVGLLVAFVAVPLFVLGRYARSSVEDLESDYRIAAICLEIIGACGGLFILGSLLRWFLIRRALYVDARGNLVVYARGWTTRRTLLPLGDLERIQYDIEHEAIRATPVHMTSRGSAVHVWIHILTLEFRSSEDGRVRHERFLLASQDTPPRAGDAVPDRVLTVGRWLSGVTGKPIVRGGIE